MACAGRVPDPKWNNYLDVPKHLAPVAGVPLLRRTVRQLRDRLSGAFDDVVVTLSTPDDRYRGPGARVVVTAADPASEYTASRPYWNEDGRTFLLLGDVYWSDPAMNTMLKYTGPRPRWFGRRGASRVTASRWGEIFAVTWTPADHETIDHHLAVVAASGSTRPPGWVLYRSIHQLDLGKHVVGPDWTEINDATDDFDVPATYLKHPAVRRARAGAGRGR